MGNEVYSAAAAIGLGALVGVTLFVPFVAIVYRRRGRLTIGRFVLWAAALVYFMAIWTYTLLPLPAAADYRCAGVNLDLWAFVGDLRGARSLTDSAVLQLALNVLLFAPLGFFLRILAGRGMLSALIAGLAVSLVIETTQVTGVWGIYPCAYRVFDVDDLLMNTAGAVVGSAVALVVPRRIWTAQPAEAGKRPHPVTRARRLLAMGCDALGAWMLAGSAGIAAQVWLEYVVRDHAAVTDGRLAAGLAASVPIAVWFTVVMVTGRTPGDLAVELVYRGGRSARPIARFLRFVGGIGGYLLLGVLPGGWAAVQIPFAALAVILVFTKVGPRGLAGLVSGQQLRDAREVAPGGATTAVRTER